LKVFSGEVVRFGNRCKDAQWHELDRYFEKYHKFHSLILFGYEVHCICQIEALVLLGDFLFFPESAESLPLKSN